MNRKSEGGPSGELVPVQNENEIIDTKNLRRIPDPSRSEIPVKRAPESATKRLNDVLDAARGLGGKEAQAREQVAAALDAVDAIQRAQEGGSGVVARAPTRELGPGLQEGTAPLPNAAAVLGRLVRRSAGSLAPFNSPARVAGAATPLLWALEQGPVVQWLAQQDAAQALATVHAAWSLAVGDAGLALR